MSTQRIKNVISENQITFFADLTLFSKEAILKCLYWFGDKFYIQISENEGCEYIIKLSPADKSLMTLEELGSHLQKLERDLIDFQLRDIVNKESRNVRDLLIAKAFSNGEYDEEPQGEISDPVGFDPTVI